LVEVATTTPVAAALPVPLAGTVTTALPPGQVEHATVTTVGTEAGTEDFATAVGMVTVTVDGEPPGPQAQVVVMVVMGTVGAGVLVQPQPVAVTRPV